MSIEAIISLLAFFCILGLFWSVAAEQNQKAKNAVDAFKARAEAQKCSLIIDSVFANSGALPNIETANCFQKEKNFIGSKSGNEEAKAIVLAPEISLNPQNTATALEVKANAHYK